jgi:tetratricopeptide (TPR) repeat protein
LALDKARTSMGVKIMLIILAVAMVGYLSAGLIGFFGSSGNNGSNSTSKGTLTTIASQYTQSIAAYDNVLRSDPTSYTVLVNAGNAYYDWALKVQDASSTDQALLGADQPMWIAAQRYYERALALNSDDPPVSVDLAIAYFYTGDTAKAIDTAGAVAKKHADFAPAWFNLGVFYGSSGDNATALADFKKAVALDPQGTSINLSYAQQQITQLQGSVTATGSATTTP